jgi:hypothetical protein
MARNSLVVCLLLSLAPTALEAQQCMGGVSFADRRASIAGDASFDSDRRSRSGSLGIGSFRGPFVSVGVGAARGDDFINAATLFTATAGAGLPLRQPRPKIQVCPFITAMTINGMEFRTPVRVGDNIYPAQRLSTLAYGLGAAVGSALSGVTAFELVPFASVAVIGRTTTTYYYSGPTHSAGDHHYDVSLGVGAVVSKVFAVRPSMTLTFVESRTNVSYGLRFSLSFGRVTQRPPAGDGEGSVTNVWVNTRANVYYCPGSTSYGATPEGAFMTEREALATGVVPVDGRRCTSPRT